MGHTACVTTLVDHGASARKLAVHRDKNLAATQLGLWATFAGASKQLETAKRMLPLLLAAGAPSSQVDTARSTVWHMLADNCAWTGVLQARAPTECAATAQLARS
jgi:hypothetical protein